MNRNESGFQAARVLCVAKQQKKEVLKHRKRRLFNQLNTSKINQMQEEIFFGYKTNEKAHNLILNAIRQFNSSFFLFGFVLF